MRRAARRLVRQGAPERLTAASRPRTELASCGSPLAGGLVESEGEDPPPGNRTCSRGDSHPRSRPPDSQTPPAVCVGQRGKAPGAPRPDCELGEDRGLLPGLESEQVSDTHVSRWLPEDRVRVPESPASGYTVQLPRSLAKGDFGVLREGCERPHQAGRAS